MNSVFVSYSRRDKRVAALVAQKLRQRGVNVWIDDQNIAPGADIVSTIRAGLDAADAVVLVLGEAEQGDTWAKREAALVLSQKSKKLIPVLASQRADVPYIIRHLSWVDMSDPATAEVKAEKLAVFLSNATEEVESSLSARSESNQVFSEALHHEIAMYDKRRDLTNARLMALITATAAFAVAAVFIALLLPDSDRILQYASMLFAGVVAGMLGSETVSKLTDFFAHRTRSKSGGME